MTEQIKNINNLEELRALFQTQFGKDGAMTARLKNAKNLSDGERTELNREKEELQAAFKTREQEIEEANIMAALADEKIDVTRSPEPVRIGRIHPMRRGVAEMSRVLIGMGYTMASGPEIETDWYNFEALNFAPHHPAREMQDSFFIDGGNIMRTHTSSVQIREMEKHGAPIKIFVPGWTYRREMDATHSPTFFQIEGLWIDTDVTVSDLVNDVKTFLARFFEREVKIRIRPSYFPFTEPSIELDMDWNGKWLEMFGAGQVHPNVLKNAGVDPNKYQGIAFGLGFDRFAMLKYGCNDIRKFYDGTL